jgi:hypothetical protein
MLRDRHDTFGLYGARACRDQQCIVDRGFGELRDLFSFTELVEGAAQCIGMTIGTKLR